MILQMIIKHKQTKLLSYRFYQEHEKAPPTGVVLRSSKDENSKPSERNIINYGLVTPKYDHTSRNSINSKEYQLVNNNNNTKLNIDGNINIQPILANLSINLKPGGGGPMNKLDQQQQRTISKEVSGINSMKEQQAVVTAINMATAADTSLSGRLSTAGKFMNVSVQLLDENLAWKEGLNEFLSDQADFLVVGVLGKCLCC